MYTNVHFNKMPRWPEHESLRTAALTSRILHSASYISKVHQHPSNPPPSSPSHWHHPKWSPQFHSSPTPKPSPPELKWPSKSLMWSWIPYARPWSGFLLPSPGRPNFTICSFTTFFLSIFYMPDTVLEKTLSKTDKIPALSELIF
jgi:hypothetical protein